MSDKVWLKPPNGDEPVEVEATSETLIPLMVKGYIQVPAPTKDKAPAPAPVLHEGVKDHE